MDQHFLTFQKIVLQNIKSIFYKSRKIRTASKISNKVPINSWLKISLQGF